MALIIVAGYSWVDGEVVTATKLNLAAVGTIAAGQSYVFGNGSSSAASISFSGDTSSGFFYAGTTGFAVSVAGVQTVSFTSAGTFFNAGIVGTTAGGNATAGNIGEYSSASVVQGAAISLANNTTTALTSITLAPGDWDLEGAAYFSSSASTVVTYVNGSLSLTSGQILYDGSSSQISFGTTLPNAIGLSLNRVRINTSASTTAYLNITGSFNTSTMTGWGQITARRVR